MRPSVRCSLPLAVLLAGCAEIGTKIDQLVDAASRGYVLLERPVTLPESQITSDCGPESICAVMNYWGKDASVEEISRLVRDPRVQGIFSTDISPLARGKGLKATFVDGSVGRIKNTVDRGVPPIIMIDVGPDTFHFYVVTGYSDRERRIVCEEYKDSKRLIGYDEVEEVWAPAGHFMVLLEVPTAHVTYEEASKLEGRGRYRQAAFLYAKALKEDPGHYEARVGLGNCYLYQGKLKEARIEYTKAYAIDPADPWVCNNLANLYLEQKSETKKAEELAERAVERYNERLRLAREAAEKETQPALRSIRHREAIRQERDLAHALGTLGQAQAANDKHVLAIASWKASYYHFPLTSFDSRAKRLYEIGLSCRAIGMPAEARTHLRKALGDVRDDALREKIEKALKQGEASPR